MNQVNAHNCRRDTSPEVNGLAMITVTDPEQEFDPGSDLWKALEERSSNHICKFEISKPGICLGGCLSRHNAALIVDSTSNGTKCGTVSLVDLSLLNEKDSRQEIPSSHGRLIASELSRIRKDGNLPQRVLLLGIEGPAENPSEAVSTIERIPLNTASLILSTLLETFGKRIAS